MSEYESPVLLDKSHEVEDFDCGKDPLNAFLKRFALQSQAAGSARTYVALRGNAVTGYYSLAPSAVSVEEAPERVKKGLARHPIPVILMARFAIDRNEQGKGLGRSLMRDAMLRALSGADQIGGRAFFVHAKDDEARAFYMKFGMEPSPANPYHLFLLFKDIRASLGGLEGTEGL